MKLKKIFWILILAFPLFCSCEDDPSGQTEEDRARILLSKTWEVGYVTVEGTDVTDLGYLLMQLNFDQNGQWQSINSNDLFASSGTWSFANGSNGKDLNTIILSETTVPIVLNPEGSTLTMRFERSGNEVIGGRSKQAGGSYEILLIPKFKP
jgi:hypothetical protein